MPWNCTRKATAGDLLRVNIAAVNFVKRHPILKPFAFHEVSDETFHSQITILLQDDGIVGKAGSVRLSRLYRACIRRALKDKTADGIVGGYVGYHVK